MCCLFGLYDYGGMLSVKQKNRIVSALAVASEVRGTDATGIAYRNGTHLCIYSRFARNTRDLLELIDQLQKKEVSFVSKKEAIDTTTPTGKFMLTVFGAVAELEREYILQRQREGIAIAKANGVYKGRKPIQRAAFDAVVSQWLRGEMTAVEAQRRLELSPSTFYRKVRDYKKTENRKEGQA